MASLCDNPILSNSGKSSSPKFLQIFIFLCAKSLSFAHIASVNIVLNVDFNNFICRQGTNVKLHHIGSAEPKPTDMSVVPYP